MAKKKARPKTAKRPAAGAVPPPRAQAVSVTAPVVTAGFTPQRRPALTMCFGDRTFDTVHLYYGDHFPESRPRGIAEGWGFAIELPAVLDMLDAVAAGQVQAADARAALLEGVAQLYGPLRCFEDEDEDDQLTVCRTREGCPLCQGERKRWFDALLDSADREWARFTTPEKYPFTAGQNGIHETTCSVVARHNPTTYARPTGPTYVEALRQYAHSVDPHSGRNYFDGDQNYPRMHSMTTEEAHQWISKNTGPKGGRNYKRCARCSPAV
ncbi:hypothetical protein JHN55_12060 [Streptomyces sp. MBT56]|uniref:hypothetical protein n=1 Tax=unclassified Streptomyces TaxID=2593676 RepID=UPI00190A76D5|nr:MULTISPECIES: hypothetical protein [unclassified Streptomyces]MBK3557252.1 hypothetical protein [Streptomyces sp. MBT56]MBK3601825.1 hypothetical protein [Streptomyces sp. MBT54]MBK3616029.1 hypothetical protein [Streptomyces sp. MBT98]